MSRIAILGAGAWGTALALSLARRGGHELCLWSHSAALAQQLADKRALRPGLSLQEAADIIFTLVSLEVYLLLTAERGWTPAHWERWITGTLIDAILR